MQHNKCIVVGGGASGMLAALYAARGGARVTLLERNEKLGKKLYITGKGRCNVTNACDMEALMQNIPRGGRFLYSALRKCTDCDLNYKQSQNRRLLVELMLIEISQIAQGAPISPT